MPICSCMVSDSGISTAGHRRRRCKCKDSLARPITSRAVLTAPRVLATLVCLAASLLAAHPPAPPIANLLRDSYGSAEGLPQNTVRSLTRTIDGYLWAATQAGLSRFDGVR